MAVVFVLALVPRAIFLGELSAFSPTFDSPEGGDSVFYDRVASGEPAPARAYFHSPLYRWFLSGIYELCGRDLLAVRMAQHLLGAVAAVLVFAVALQLFRRLSVAVVAGLVSGWLGPVIFYEGQLLVDGLGALLVTAALCAIVAAARTRSAEAIALGGIALGVAALGRAVVLVWLPIVALWIASWAGSWRFRAGRVGVLLAALGLVIAPVALRNYLVEGDLVLITANGGLNLYVGNNPDASGSYTLPEGLWFRPGDPLDDFAGRKVAAHALGRDLSSSELSRWWAARAVRFAADEPAKVAGLALEKLRILANDYEYPQLYNYYAYRDVAPMLSRLPTASFALAPGLVGLGWLGLGRSGKTRRLVVLLTLVYGLAFVPFFVVGRYRAAWLALLAPFAGWVLVSIVRALRARRYRPAIALLGATGALLVLTSLPLGAHPTPALQYLEFARAASRAEDWPQTVRWAERATEAGPDRPESWAELGRALRNAAERDRADRVLSSAAERFPEAAEVLRELAATRLEQGRAASASRLLERAIAAHPGDAASWELLGRSLEERGCGERAAQAYRAALALVGERSDAAGRLRQRIGDLERGRAAGERSAPDCEP